MDPATLSFYKKNAEATVAGYESIPSPLAPYFPMAFASGQRLLDVGAGSGRDMAALLAMGCDVMGLEPSAPMRDMALSHHPELAGRILDESGLAEPAVRPPGRVRGNYRPSKRHPPLVAGRKTGRLTTGLIYLKKGLGERTNWSQM